MLKRVIFDSACFMDVWCEYEWSVRLEKYDYKCQSRRSSTENICRSVKCKKALVGSAEQLQSHMRPEWEQLLSSVCTHLRTVVKRRRTAGLTALSQRYSDMLLQTECVCVFLLTVGPHPTLMFYRSAHASWRHFRVRHVIYIGWCSAAESG